MRWRVVTLAATALFVAAVASCTVVEDGRVDPINPPFGLDDTIESSTTATSTTLAETTTTSGQETTTTGVQTEQVRLYFISSGQLTYVVTALSSPPTLSQIVAALQEGPPEGDVGRGLRSAVPDDALIAVNFTNTGVAEVQLPEGFFSRITGPDQRFATAQLVLTLTDSRGVGQVAFDVPVPKPSGELAPAGQALSRADFTGLLENSNNVTADTGAP